MLLKMGISSPGNFSSEKTENEAKLIRKSPVRTFTAALLLLASAACSDSGSNSPTASGRPSFGPGGGGLPATRVIGVPVTFLQDTDKLESVGTARARQAATILPQSSGEITSVRFESGQYIEAGSILATIDSAEQRLAVARARVTLENAEQLLARYERIDVDGAISESQIDSAKTTVEAAKIELQLAEEALSRRTIYAPFSGYVGLSDIDPGATVTQQTEITRIDDRSELFVDFSLPEQVFGRINEGDELPLVPFADSQTPVNAVISVVDSRIDEQRRSYMVRALVDNSSDQLRPGMSFRVNFDLPGDRYPAAPEAAIVWGGDGPYLYKIEDGTAQRVPITIVSRQDGQVLVRAPLNTGDVIISEGVQKVRQGSPVIDISGTPAFARPEGSGSAGEIIAGAARP